jgi:hypothetical protein
MGYQRGSCHHCYRLSRGSLVLSATGTAPGHEDSLTLRVANPSDG